MFWFLIFSAGLAVFLLASAVFSPPRVKRKKKEKPAAKKREKGKTGGDTETEKAPRLTHSKFIKPSMPLVLAAIAVPAAVYWLTRWPALAFMFFCAVAITPYLKVSNSPRQKDINACETVEKLADNIINMTAAGASLPAALEESLKIPTTTFQEGSKECLRKLKGNMAAGILEVRNQIRHSMGDMLAATLYYAYTSEATGAVGEPVGAVRDAAREIGQMEKRVMREQTEGYMNVKVVLWITLCMMAAQKRIGGVGGVFDIYDTPTGQMLLLAVGFLIAMGVWMGINLSQGKPFLRIGLDISASQEQKTQ